MRSRSNFDRPRGFSGRFEVLEDRLVLTALFPHLDAAGTSDVFRESENLNSAIGTIANSDVSFGNEYEVLPYGEAQDDTRVVVERNAIVAMGGGMADEVLVVHAGETFVLTRSEQYEGIIIEGDFVVEDSADIELITDWVLVLDGGSFQVGSEANPFTHEFTLTLEGDDPNFDLVVADYLPGNATVVSDNNAYLMARGAGSTIQIHGDDAAKESWTQLSQTAQAGETVLHLDEATGWEVGDRVAIASTDFDLNQAEDFTITAVANGGQTITLDAPLQYMHYGEIETYSNGDRSWDLDMRAEVALLTRDVTIQGDADSAINRYGGHTMVMMGAEMYISGVEFTRMGQEGIIGRYPAHWHLIGDASGQYIQHSSFHNTFNKGLTVHGTQNALVHENVLYEHIGHGYFLEDAAEFDNVLTYNLAINARASDSPQVAPEPSDFAAVSSFWIENADNTFIGNHAAGSEFEGFRFDLQLVNGASAGLGLYDDLDPRTKGPTDFTGNVAHSTAEAGLFITTPLVREIQDTQPTADDQQLFDEDWGFSDFTSYKGHDTFWPRAMGGDFYDIKLGENDRADRLRLNNTLYDSLIVGRTGNIGTPTTPEEIAAGRSLPPVTGSYLGHILYDGPAGLVDSHLDGFDAGDDAAIGIISGRHKSTYQFVSGLTFGANLPEARKVGISQQANNVNAENSVRAIVDLDGSLTGFAGATVTPMLGRGSLMNTTAAGISRDDWNAWVNPDVTIGSITFNYESGALVEHDIIRSDGASIIGTRGAGHHTQTGFVVDDQFTHTVDFTDNSLSQIDIYLGDMRSGEAGVFDFPDFDPLSSVTVYNPYTGESWDANQVASEAELQAATTTSVYRGGGSLQVKFVSEIFYGWLWPQPALLPQQGSPGLGDYDLSGTVDRADYDVWSEYFGATSGARLTADGNGNGVVDLADYSVWLDNLGTTYESAAGLLGGVTVSIDSSNLVSSASTSSLLTGPVAIDIFPEVEAATVVAGAPPAELAAVVDAALLQLLVVDEQSPSSDDDPWEAWEEFDSNGESDRTSHLQDSERRFMDSWLQVARMIGRV